MRGTAGLWVAIVFLGAAAAAFGGLYFSQQSGLQEAKEAVVNLSAQQLANDGEGRKANASVRSLLQQKGKLQEVVDQLQEDIDKMHQGMRNLQSDTKEKQEKIKMAARRLEELNDEVSRKNNEIAKIRQKIQEVRDSKNEQGEQELNSARENYLKVQGRVEELTRKLTSQQEKEQAMRQAFLRRISELQRESSALRGVVDKVQRDTGQRQAMKEEDYDGKIIEVDIDNKFVVINLGKAHRIRRGMRFDVIRWRLNKWDFMGAVEITSVGATTSQGVIMDEIRRQKVCPVTGYIARGPEEIVSPYVVGPNDRAVRLIDNGVEEKPSMKKLDPIVAGDFITNPFYSKDRTLKFVVAGEPVTYSASELKAQIKKDNAIIQEKVDVDTDYLILGRIPEESTAVTPEAAKQLAAAKLARDTAKQYGIPIMREIELFNFLRK